MKARPVSEVQEKPSIDPTPELRKMVELVVSLPALGPPLASLAFKLGHKELGERISAMGQDGSQVGVEYFFVRAQTARREKRFAEVVHIAVEAIGKVATASAEQRSNQEDSRLLHLIRLGFSVALFDLNDVTAASDMAKALVNARSALEPQLKEDGFFHSLLAQALWFDDKDQSESQWERALQCGDAETTWNARGTWYKDAEADKHKAESTYRKGLDSVPESALLLHNVAQLLVERGIECQQDAKKARRYCNQADELLRRALRQDSRLRRHIHATRDRLFELRKQLPPDESRKNSGGRRPGPGTNRPARADADAGTAKANDAGTAKANVDGRDRPGKGNSFSRSGKMSLGDMLLAKLENKPGSVEGKRALPDEKHSGENSE